MDKFKDLDSIDKSKIFDAIDAQPDQLRLNFADDLGSDIVPEMGEGIENIVLAGMGGSALAGDLAKNWLSNRLNKPFEIIRSYDLPDYINTRSLVIISSYSGNTEEALSALEEAEKFNAQIIIMSAGGKLSEIAKQKNYILFKLPKVSQPRLSVFAGLKALACMFEDFGFVQSDLRRELLETANFLDIQKAAFGLDDAYDNLAHKIALDLYGKPVIIYSGPVLKSAGHKWKIDINENAKQLAFANCFPELNHNEFQGWIFPEKKYFNSIVLISSLDSEKIKLRAKLTTQILKKHGFIPTEISSQGSNLIQHMLYGVILGDYVSAYLAVLNKVDPTPVDMVEHFKEKLK